MRTFLVSLLFYCCAITSWGAEPLHVRALAYNVGLLDFWKYSIVPLTPQRGAKLPAALAAEGIRDSLDVIALEEVWHSGPARDIRRQLEGAGYKVFRFPDHHLYGTGLL